MNEFKSKVKIERATEKNFGIVFSIFFLLLSIYPIFFDNNINYFFFSLSFILIFISFLIPKILKYPNFLWYKFGELIGFIISPLVMLLIYLIAFLPIGLIFKLLRKDLINIKIDKNQSTYWIKKSTNNNNMKNQF